MNLIPVATMHVVCPECFESIPMEVTATIDGGSVSIDPDTSGVWDHAFTHVVQA